MIESAPVDVPEDLSKKRLIIVTGKGGVGRTTISAALALMLARRGRRTLLYQANAKGKLAQLLAVPPIDDRITRVRDRLWAVNTNPDAALHEYGLMVLRFERVYRMVFENRIAKALIRAIPGLDDYSIVGKMWFHTTEEEAEGEPRWPTIVFDAPATGHAVTMLKIPRAILDAVPEGPLTRDAVKVRQLLEDASRTAVVLVTLAEEMPVNESIELYEKLSRDVGMNVPYVIANQLYPDRFSDGKTPSRVLAALIEAGAQRDHALGPILQRARTIATRRGINDRYLARLAREIPVRRLDVPLLFTPSLGPADAEKISSILEGQLFPGGQT